MLMLFGEEQGVSRGWAAQGRQLELTVGLRVGSREEEGAHMVNPPIGVKPPLSWCTFPSGMKR